MFKQSYKWGVALLLILSGMLLAGCGDSEKASKSSKDVSTKQVQQKAEKSLNEQGYRISTIKTYGENVNVVYLQKDGKKYVGTVDDSFSWLMQPTDEYKKLEFHEGLAASSVPETRKMRIADHPANHPEAKLWGFINTKGEWVIKPIYRQVKDFSSGVAIVSTVEEDRDDLANQKVIVVDKEGKKIAELSKKMKWFNFASDFNDTYFGDYLYDDFHGAYDKNGKHLDFSFDDADKITIIGDKVINGVYEDEDYISKVEIRDLNGNLIKNLSSDSNIYDLYINPTLMKSNLFQVELDSGSDALVNTDGAIVFEGDEIEMGYADGLAFVHKDTSGSNGISGTFYDLTGKEQFSVKKMIGHIYLNSRYFIKGKEYYT